MEFGILFVDVITCVVVRIASRFVVRFEPQEVVLFKCPLMGSGLSWRGPVGRLDGMSFSD